MANLGWPERVMFVLAASRFALAPRRFAIATPHPPKCLRAAYIIVLPTKSQDTALDTNMLERTFSKKYPVGSPCPTLTQSGCLRPGIGSEITRFMHRAKHHLTPSFAFYISHIIHEQTFCPDKRNFKC